MTDHCNLERHRERATQARLLRSTAFAGKLYSVLLLPLALLTAAPSQTVNRPPFDPTPLQIPQVEKASLRSVTSMDLLTLRDLHGSQISPDGKWLAFILGQAVYESDSYRSGLFIISTEKDSRPICLGSAGPPHWDDGGQWVQEDPQWSADSKFIFYRSKHDHELWQVWKWGRGGPAVQVTHVEHNVQSFQVSPDGLRLLLTVEKPIDKRGLAKHGILYDGSFGAGLPLPLVDYIAISRGVETETWLHDFEDGHDRKASQEESEAGDSWVYPPPKLFTKDEIEGHQISNVKISPDGKRLAYERYLSDVSESPQGVIRLFSRPIQGGDPADLTPRDSTPQQFWWSADSKEIYYTELHTDIADELRPAKLMAVPAVGGKARNILDSIGFQYNYSIDRSKTLLACTYEDTTTPAELRLVDLSAGEVRTLADINPEFHDLQLSPTQRIEVSNKYGDHFFGHLVFPLHYESGKRYPLIITLYRDGNSFLRGGTPGDEYPIRVFAANGFAVLNFDVGEERNSKPEDFESIMLQWDSPMEGIAAAVAKLAHIGIVDPSRVGITGLSFGAEMVKYGISHTDLFRAAIASGPSWEPSAYDFGNDFIRGYFSHNLHLESPDGEARVRWQRLSAALNASHIHAPLLLNEADSEYLGDLQLVTEMRELKRPVEMFIYANEFHIKNYPAHRYEIYQRNVDWFRFWLKDETDSDPAKAEQRKRWRELRAMRDKDQGNALHASGGTASKP
jgi:dipeptidyl aminopeptidase/acylaminoacyl peptidase